MAIGAAVGAVGTLLAARESRRGTEAAARAAQFRGFDVTGPYGQVDVDESGRVNLSADPQQQALFEAWRNYGLEQMGAAHQGVANVGGVAGIGRTNLGFGDPGTLDAQMLRTMGMNNSRMAGQFLNAAQGLDLNAMAQQRLSQLNSLATPFEDRQAADLADRLFGSGQVGTAGGREQFSELAGALERAQTERLLAATQFAADEQNRLMGLGMGLQGNAGNFLSQAFSQGLQRNQFLMERGMNQFAQNQAIGQHNLARAQFDLQRAMARFGTAGTMFETGQALDPFQNLMAQAALSNSMSSAAAGAGANVGSFIQSGANTRTNLIGSLFSGLMSGLNPGGG